MKEYEKPTVIATEELSEGIYMASGSVPDCWTVFCDSVQDWDGSSHIFEVRGSHSNDVQHISSKTTVVLTFDKMITNARSEFPCSFSGNTVTIERELLANAYLSGDKITYKVWVSCGNEAETKSVACINAKITCTHKTNVQGEYD